MLQARDICASIGDETVEDRAVRGCPQSGALSPLIWCLVVDYLLWEFNGQGVRAIGYANDIEINLAIQYET